MEEYLFNYFNSIDFEYCISELKKLLKKKSQIETYDFIYNEFHKKTEEYNQDTVIPKLDKVIKFFILVLFYRDNIFGTQHQLHQKTKEWFLKMMNMTNFTQKTFIYTAVLISYSIIENVDFHREDTLSNYVDVTPIELLIIDYPIMNYKGPGNGLIDHSEIEISSESNNKWFYYIILGKAGLFTFFDMANMLLISDIEYGFSKIPLNLKTHYNINDRIGPHEGVFDSPENMLHHDMEHSLNIIQGLKEYNNTDFKLLYLNLDHNTKTFNYRMFSMLVWYMYFESTFNRYKDVSILDPFRNEFNRNNFYIGIQDNNDRIYVIDFILKSIDLPDELSDDLLIFNNFDKNEIDLLKLLTKFNIIFNNNIKNIIC